MKPKIGLLKHPVSHTVQMDASRMTAWRPNPDLSMLEQLTIQWPEKSSKLILLAEENLVCASSISELKLVQSRAFSWVAPTIPTHFLAWCQEYFKITGSKVLYVCELIPWFATGTKSNWKISLSPNLCVHPSKEYRCVKWNWKMDSQVLPPMESRRLLFSACILDSVACYFYCTAGMGHRPLVCTKKDAALKSDLLPFNIL